MYRTCSSIQGHSQVVGRHLSVQPEPSSHLTGRWCTHLGLSTQLHDMENVRILSRVEHEIQGQELTQLRLQAARLALQADCAAWRPSLHHGRSHILLRDLRVRGTIGTRQVHSRSKPHREHVSGNDAPHAHQRSSRRRACIKDEDAGAVPQDG